MQILESTEETFGEFIPKNYEGWGELIKSYLDINENNKLFTVANINDQEELWKFDNFIESFRTKSASIDNLAIGYLGFGKIRVNGVYFKAVMEQNASPIIIHISEISFKIIKEMPSIELKEVI